MTPGLGRSPGEGIGTHSSILAWKIKKSQTPLSTYEHWVLGWSKRAYDGSGKMKSVRYSDEYWRARALWWLIITGVGSSGTPLQYSCLENPTGRGAWWAAVHGVTKSWTQLSDFTFTFHFHALEKEMATHSSVLAWRIPGKAEPGGLWGHTDWSNLAAAGKEPVSSEHSFLLILTVLPIYSSYLFSESELQPSYSSYKILYIFTINPFSM